MQTCFGSFAIRRADMTNDAMFDPDSALRVRLGALVVERKSWVSDKKQLIVVFLKRRRQSKESVEPQTCEGDN